MNYEIDLDPEHSVIRLTVTAENVTLELADEIYRHLSEATSTGGPYAAIYDLSATKRTSIPTDTVRSLARRRPSIPMGRSHVIVGTEPVIFGLGRVFQMCSQEIGIEFQVVNSLEEAYKIIGVEPEDFTECLIWRVSGYRASRLLCRGSRNGHRARDSRGDSLDVGHELRVQGHVQAVRACRVQGVDDHAKGSEPGASILAAWGLTRDVTASIVDSYAVAVFSAGRTLVSTNFATFTTSLAAVARACSTLVINALILFLLSPPLTAGGAGLLK